MLCFRCSLKAKVFVYGRFARLRQVCSFTGANIYCGAEGGNADFRYFSVMR